VKKQGRRTVLLKLETTGQQAQKGHFQSRSFFLAAGRPNGHFPENQLGWQSQLQ
jgi:hypothetical protein